MRDKLVSSYYIKDSPCGPARPKCTSRCGKCALCRWVQPGRKLKLPNGEFFYPNFCTACETQGVVYLMKCIYGAFYVGKTVRQLRQRKRDHIYTSGNSKMLTPVSRHLDLHQKCNTCLVLCSSHYPQRTQRGEMG